MLVPGMNTPVGKGIFPGAAHEPPAFGVPPNRVNRSTLAPELQTVSVPLFPASGASTSFTATVAEVDGQTPVAATVKVYVPGVIVAGLYRLFTPMVLMPVQVPVAVVPSMFFRLIAAPLEQPVVSLLTPGLAAACTETVTVAEAFEQGDCPTMV